MPVNILAADRIPGMTPCVILQFLAEEAQKSRTIAEIGCWRGRSTRAMADNTSGAVYAIDTWQGSDGLELEMAILRQQSGDPDFMYHEFLRNVADSPNINVIRKRSVDAAADFPDHHFDLVWIDGAHDYESVMADLRAWAPKMAPGSLLCGDDYHHPPVAKAFHDFFGCAPPANPDARVWGWRVPAEVEVPA